MTEAEAEVMKSKKLSALVVSKEGMADVADLEKGSAHLVAHLIL